MPKLVRKDYIIEGVMKAGYSREDGQLIADMAEKTLNDVYSTVNRNAELLPDHLYPQATSVFLTGLIALTQEMLHTLIEECRGGGIKVTTDDEAK